MKGVIRTMLLDRLDTSIQIIAWSVQSYNNICSDSHISQSLYNDITFFNRCKTKILKEGFGDKDFFIFPIETDQGILEIKAVLVRAENSGSVLVPLFIIRNLEIGSTFWTFYMNHSAFCFDEPVSSGYS